MITIPGTLLVETCRLTHAKKGSLKSSVGRFNVKSDQLNQLDDGQYKGHFEVAQFSIAPNKHRSGIYFELEVSISNIALLLTEKTTEKQKGTKLKRGSKELDQQDTIQKSLFEQETVEVTTENAVEIENADLSIKEKELFGSIWPLGQSVQLDSTIPREKLHLQIAHLRQSGYLPNKDDQCWYKTFQ